MQLLTDASINVVFRLDFSLLGSSWFRFISNTSRGKNIDNDMVQSPGKGMDGTVVWACVPCVVVVGLIPTRDPLPCICPQISPISSPCLKLFSYHFKDRKWHKTFTRIVICIPLSVSQ